jgi:CAAX protease family protein
MIHFVKEELVGLGRFLKGNGRVTIVIFCATLFICLDRYHSLPQNWQGDLLYYGFLPLLVILIVLRKNPLDFGLRLGRPRIWGKYVFIICLAAAVVLYLASFISALQNYYIKDDFSFASYFLTSCASLASQEFLYRGFLLFGLKEKFKEGSILVQMIPFALLHLGKPELETISTLFTGILFGYVAYRGKSF